MKIDFSLVETHIRDVAAERIIPRFQKLQAHEINAKSGPSDLVTVADIEAEHDLTRIFKDLLPGSEVVGEEAVSRGDINLVSLRHETQAVWVVDPVDGTNNFAAGRPVFGTMVALVQGGQTRGAWIYDIPGNRMGTAEQGGGCYVDGVKCSPPESHDDLSSLRGYISTKFVPPHLRAEIKEKIDPFTGFQEGLMCCAHEYMALVTGEKEFSFYSRIKPWDHLAGVLMHEECGGYARKWNGDVYAPGDEKGGLISTPDQKIWSDLKSLLGV